MVLSPFFILLPPHYSRFPQKIQAAHGSFFPPRLPQHSFWFAASNREYLYDMPALLLSSAKKHPPQDVQQVPEI
jgi:hypothetical protein